MRKLQPMQVIPAFRTFSSHMDLRGICIGLVRYPQHHSAIKQADSEFPGLQQCKASPSLLPFRPQQLRDPVEVVQAVILDDDPSAAFALTLADRDSGLDCLFKPPLHFPHVRRPGW